MKQIRCVPLSQDKKLWLEISLFTGLLSVFLENTSEKTKQKIVEIFPSGKIGKHDSSHVLSSFQETGMIAQGVPIGKANFKMDSHIIEIESLLRDKSEITKPLHKFLAWLKILSVNKITVRLDGVQIFYWE